MYMLSVPSEPTALILFPAGVEISVFIGSLATDYGPEDKTVCSSVDSTSGPAAPDRSTLLQQSLVIPQDLSDFLQGVDND